MKCEKQNTYCCKTITIYYGKKEIVSENQFDFMMLRSYTVNRNILIYPLK
jgi:hypothetical protein